MSICQWKLRMFPGDEGVFQCRRQYGHEQADPTHEATGMYEYQVISWFNGDRRQFLGEWVPCDTAGCVFPLSHPGSHEK